MRPDPSPGNAKRPPPIRPGAGNGWGRQRRTADVRSQDDIQSCRLAFELGDDPEGLRVATGPNDDLVAQLDGVTISTMTGPGDLGFHTGDHAHEGKTPHSGPSRSGPLPVIEGTPGR